MLKIKDNVDLKELEKYGFEPRYDTYTGEIDYFENMKDEHIGLEIKTVCQTSIISIFSAMVGKKKRWYYQINTTKFTDEVQDILYDLIKADLVEKVQ